MGSLANPSVDILMATYNGDKYLAEQIKSIQNQTYANWKLLISDDCSNDNTIKIIKDFMKRDNRILLVSNGVRFGSAKSNFTFLLTKSHAPYTMFCDQDDFWLPNKIRLSLDKIIQLENKKEDQIPILVFSDMQVVDKNLNEIAGSFEIYSAIKPNRIKFNQILAQSVGAGCTMICNKKLVQLALKTPQNTYMIMHDWWLSLIASSFGEIGHIDVATSLYRQHEVNSVGAESFSALDRVKHIRRMTNRFIKSVRQAESFNNVYGYNLNKKYKYIINNYISILYSNRFGGLVHLFKSGCWKSGIRKIGQISGIILGMK